MAAGKQQQQGAVVSSPPPPSDPPSAARRLWRVVRAVLYMLRRGLPSGRKLAMDLHLLLHRGKIAGGKALGALFLASSSSSHSHSHHGLPYAGAAASCRALDPGAAVHEPAPRARREVEFSCSNTPSSAAGGGGGGLRLGLLGASRRRSRRSRQAHQVEDRAGELGYPPQCYGYDAAEVARVFEMLSDDDDAVVSAAATPSPAAAQLVQHWASSSAAAAGVGRSPADGAQGQVDRRADEFIRRFYEQLRAQRSAASTPDYYGAGTPSPYAAGATTSSSSRAPWPVAAGIGA